MQWKDSLKKGCEIVVSTCVLNKPHIIVVISQGFVDNKIMFSICQSMSTLRNLQKNKNLCIYTKNKGGYYRIKGQAEIHKKGKYFALGKKWNQGPMIKCAVLVKISEVFDLDKVKKIDL